MHLQILQPFNILNVILNGYSLKSAPQPFLNFNGKWPSSFLNFTLVPQLSKRFGVLRDPSEPGSPLRHRNNHSEGPGNEVVIFFETCRCNSELARFYFEGNGQKVVSLVYVLLYRCLPRK